MTIKTNTVTVRNRKKAVIKTTGAATITDAWALFLERLEPTLKGLHPGQWVILQKKDSASDWIQFAHQGKAGFRVESKSNFYRNVDDQLTPEQVAGLVQLGWLSPTGSDEESTPENDPEGSPNFYVDLSVKLSLKDLDALVSRTFINIFGVSGPDQLLYEAYEVDGSALLLPALGLKAVTTDADQNASLAQSLLDVIREITGTPELSWDADGDIGPICFGDIRTFVRIVEGGTYIRFYSPLLNGAYETLALLSKLNELNTVQGFMHLCLKEDCVMSVADIAASPLVTEHIKQVLANFMQVSDEFATELVAEFVDEEESKQQLIH
jgi:hypothetical protein